jgi:hypothetical protein
MRILLSSNAESLWKERICVQNEVSVPAGTLVTGCLPIMGEWSWWCSVPVGTLPELQRFRAGERITFLPEHFGYWSKSCGLEIE